MKLLQEHFDIAVETPDGIQKLRELILSLAMQGKLVPQNTTDQPASQLLKEVEAEKKRLVKQGNIKEQKPLPPIKEEEIPHALPKGWEWVRLIDLLEIINGRAYSAEELLDAGTPVLRVGNLFTSNQWYYSDLTLEENKYIDEGDLIYAWSASFGPFIWRGPRVIYHYHIWKMLLHKENPVLKGFLYQFLLQKTSEIKASGHGISMKHMTKEKMEKLVIPVPPLIEQARVVAKIDQLMALCDKLEAQRNERDKKRLTVHASAMSGLLNASNKGGFNRSWSFITKHFNELYSVTENVAELKKAILQLAVMGKLVPQDPNHQPASELLKEIESEKKRLVKEGKIREQKALAPIKEEEIPYEVPKGWEWVRLGEVILFTNGFAFKSSSFQTTGIGIIKIGDISNGAISKEKMDYVDESFLSTVDEKFRVLPGDLLIAMSGATTGKLGFNKTDEVYLLNQRVGKIEPILIEKEYAYHYLSTLINKNLEISSGSAIPNLSTEQITNTLMPLPPRSEQKRIVARIEQLMSISKKLDEHLSSASAKRTAIFDAVLARV